MLLAGRNAIIYGAGGAIGGGVARAFAAEGARVFLAGRTRSHLATVASEITISSPVGTCRASRWRT
jgi:3-oxoacyl-[acyl-carrier protein] reductase